MKHEFKWINCLSCNQQTLKSNPNKLYCSVVCKRREKIRRHPERKKQKNHNYYLRHIDHYKEKNLKYRLETLINHQN